ncbi:unnamed protein product [Parnassius apollo]|uniref:L antigen family member 3 n=1 Tax=Parnassius apollo TaxID=110799 RepID=A0A8S3WV61_PARAO|nr:unnamed protein product [Parnassius apollo]
MAEEYLKNITLNIPFASTKQASIAYDILIVDEELQGSRITREILINNAELIISFEGTDTKRLRVAVNVALKNLLMIIKTLSDFAVR